MAARRHFGKSLTSVWQLAGFALAATVLSLLTYWYHPGWLESFDQRGRDVVFQLRTTLSPPDDVAVVLVDERSVKTHGRWPWPRATQAELLRALDAAGSGVIALDIVYAQADQRDCPCAAPELTVAAVLEQLSTPVVGGFFLRNQRTGETQAEALQLARNSRIKSLLVSAGGHTNNVPVYAHMELNRAEIARHLTAVGVFNRSTDSDGIARTAPLVLGYAGTEGEPEFMPSLSLQALSVYLEETPGLIADKQGLRAVKLGQRHIPVDGQGRMAVNFYPPQPEPASPSATMAASTAASTARVARHGGITAYSAADVLSGAVGAEALQHKLLFVGVSEIGIADLLPTPVDPLLPGVALHATVAANILQQQYLYRNLDTVLIDVAMIAVIPMALVFSVAGLRKLWQMGLVFALFAALLFAIFYYLVARQHHLVSLVYPATAVATAFVAFQVYYILTAQRTTQFLTSAFSAYVAPELVKRLLAQPERLGLSGEKRELTLLFSDIRGFTTIAEQLTPEQLVTLLNQLLGRLSDAILAHSGTLDKYIGDAVMALFNAPLNIEHHADEAVKAALAMQQACGELRDHYRQAFGVELRIGIGIHSGEAIVGNLGSEQRFDYTAIGDNVNLASRVESITKYYGVDIIVTAETVELLKEHYILRRLDDIRVKGKSVPVTIYELVMPERSSEYRLMLFEQSLAAYRQRRFGEALQGFKQLLDDDPGDGPTQIYVQRCTSYLNNPPAADWDGVFEATTK